MSKNTLQSNEKKIKSPKNYYGRKERRKVLTLILGLGLVIVMIAKLGNEEFREGLSSIFGDIIAQKDLPKVQRGLSTDPDRFLDGVKTYILANISDDKLPPNNEKIARKSDKPRPKTTKSAFAGDEIEFFSDIRSNEIINGKLHPDRLGWLHFFELAEEYQEPHLATAANDVTRMLLLRQSDAFRGEVVTIRGRVRMAREMKMPMRPGEQPKEKVYYELAIAPNDSPGEPMVLHVTELPEGFPLGDDLNEPCFFNAFFIKKYVEPFPGQEWKRLTPFLIGKTIHWRGAPKGTPQAAEKLKQQEKPWYVSIWTGVGFGIIFAILLCWYVLFVTSRKPTKRPHKDLKIEIPKQDEK